MSALPEYPRLQPQSTVRLTREWSATAWAGTADKLLVIQREIEDALARAYGEAISGLSMEDPESEVLATSIGKDLRLTVRATGGRGRVTRTGELASILAEMDLAEIEALEFVSKASNDELPNVSLLFRRTQQAGEKALELSVSGWNRQWVGGLFDVLTPELRKGVRWWRFLRNRGAWIILSIPVFVIFFNWLFLSISPVVDSETGLEYAPVDQSGGGILVGAFVGFVIGGLLGLAAEHLFPAFEVVELGSSTRAMRALRMIGVILGSIATLAGVVLGFMAL